MPIPWDVDPPGSAARTRRNLEEIVRGLAEAAAERAVPTADLACDWHRRIFAGVTLPVPYYAGEVRDDDPRFPELVGYEVRVGPQPGLPSREVPAALHRFEVQMQRAVALLDAQVPVGEVPRETGTLGSVVTLCALAHGEWARIHPFANGNGRIARLWANWSALRYGLPPFVRLRPRPEGFLYSRAAGDSMRGDHRATVALFADWLQKRILGTL